MQKITRSLAITSLFPKSMESWGALEKAVRFLEGFSRDSFPFTQIEFYHPPGHDRELGRLFENSGFSSVLIGVFALKGAGLSLCSLDGEERNKAVALLKNCMDRAAETGSHSVMINSGFIPAYKSGSPFSAPSQEQIRSSCAAYVRSVEEAAEYGEKRGYAVNLLLEPGDSKVQSFQLLGPADLVLETSKQIRSVTGRYALTMDTAHIREEGEDVMTSLSRTLPWCNHVHFCNCVMDDPANPLYGDKHVDFDCPGAVWDYDAFGVMFEKIRKLYGDRDFTITLEITCRAEDNEAWFRDIVSRCPWLFK